MKQPFRKLQPLVKLSNEDFGQMVKSAAQSRSEMYLREFS